jgi:hypothetical protein
MNENKACDNADPSCLVQKKSGISRREALKTSAIALGSCYLAPATMNLLLADSASAQGSGGQEDESFSSSLRICNFLLKYEDMVRVAFIDVFGPSVTLIPGGNDPNSGVSYNFPDLLDGGDVTISTEDPAYYTFMTPEETVQLESYLSAGDDQRVQSLLSAIVSDDNGMIDSLTITLNKESRSLVVSTAAPG